MRKHTKKAHPTNLHTKQRILKSFWKLPNFTCLGALNCIKMSTMEASLEDTGKLRGNWVIQVYWYQNSIPALANRTAISLWKGGKTKRNKTNKRKWAKCREIGSTSLSVSLEMKGHKRDLKKKDEKWELGTLHLKIWKLAQRSPCFRVYLGQTDLKRCRL